MIRSEFPELAQWLEALAALAEDLALAPRTHRGWLTTTVTPAPRSLIPFPGLYGYMHTCGEHTYTRAQTHTHKIKQIFKGFRFRDDPSSPTFP